MPAKMGSSRSCLPACLTSSSDWHFIRSIFWGFQGAGAGGFRFCSPKFNLGREMAIKDCRPTNVPSGVAAVLPDRIK
eukprot:1137084-Pelagomonas_calceolata.AAC.3